MSFILINEQTVRYKTSGSYNNIKAEMSTGRGFEDKIGYMKQLLTNVKHIVYYFSQFRLSLFVSSRDGQTTFKNIFFDKSI